MNLAIPVRQRIFIYEYVKHGCGKKAAQAAEYSNPGQAAANLLNPKTHPLVVQQIEEMMTELEAKTELTAEYMRQYLIDILEADHHKYFKPSSQGRWEISAEDYDKLPHKVKRLIEDIEYRQITIGIGPQMQTVTKMCVTFISKTEAMKTAAKHVLTQRLLVQGESSIDFDEISKRVAAKRASRIGETKVEPLAIEAPKPKI